MSPSSSQIVTTTAVAAFAAAGIIKMIKSHRPCCKAVNKIPKALLKSKYSEELKLAVRLASRAGSNMVGYVESKGTVEESNYSLDIETKSGAADFCTKVDVENEAMVMEGIKKVFPDHEIIGEETTGTGEVPPLTKAPTWIIDPIDGTTNFSQGLNMTCISIGFCDGGVPVVGVIYAPVTDEWYLAVKGHGAFRNGQLITDRSKQAKKKTLQKAVICCEFGYSRKQAEIDAMLGAVSRILSEGCRGIRQLGSGCLDLCYVATGRLDIVYAGVVNEGWKPWDYAAGLVVCQESGCIMESINQTAGEPFDLYAKSILCGTTRELVDECRSLLLKK